MTKSLAKFLIILATCVVMGFFVTGIVQSAVLEAKRVEANALQNQISELEDEVDAINDPEFENDYHRQIENQGGENDILFN